MKLSNESILTPYNNYCPTITRETFVVHNDFFNYSFISRQVYYLRFFTSSNLSVNWNIFRLTISKDYPNILTNIGAMFTLNFNLVKKPFLAETGISS